jgi:hypothetical protein
LERLREPPPQGHGLPQTRAIFQIDYVNPNGTTGSCHVIAVDLMQARALVLEDEKTPTHCGLVGDIPDAALRQTHPVGILRPRPS